MTEHLHSERVPGCYRCELGIDEAMSALALERDEAVEMATQAVAMLREWRDQGAPGRLGRLMVNGVIDRFDEEYGE